MVGEGECFSSFLSSGLWGYSRIDCKLKNKNKIIDGGTMYEKVDC